MKKKIMTLCCVHDSEKILLGEIKKHGVLKGRYNGFGGKLEEGETIDQAARRELHEEAEIRPLDMTKKGVLSFEFEEDGNPFEGKPVLEVHVFSVTKFEGEPKETEEMRPEWFNLNRIPFDAMWPDDPLWFPLLLAGKKFVGKFFLKDAATILKYELEEVDIL